MDNGNILDRLLKGDIIVFDGAFGTILLENDLEPGECPDILNLKNPGRLEEIASSYADAGADVIHTGTFSSSPMKLADLGLEDKLEEINRRAVEILKNSVGEKALISASIGPSGKILLPYGDTPPDLLFDGYKRQIEILYDSGIDFVTIETMTDINEAIIAVKAAKSVDLRLPVVCTMTFDKIPRGYYTIMGNDVKTVSKELENAGADIIGSNCGNGLDIMIEIAEEFLKHTNLPVAIQSNAGKPEFRNGNIIYPEGADYFAERIKKLVDTGVRIIGGCCGTTPEHIRRIREIVDSKSK
ncbi:homocysteine S-methyltransferase family protein [candidate division KSB1 bacterium]